MEAGAKGYWNSPRKGSPFVAILTQRLLLTGERLFAEVRDNEG